MNQAPKEGGSALHQIPTERDKGPLRVQCRSPEKRHQDISAPIYSWVTNEGDPRVLHEIRQGHVQVGLGSVLHPP